MALSNLTGVPIGRRTLNTQTLRMHAHKGKTMGGHSKKVAVCKPRTDASGETNPADILILDSQPPELWEIDFCCLSRCLSCFVMAARADSYAPMKPWSKIRESIWPWDEAAWCSRQALSFNWFCSQESRVFKHHFFPHAKCKSWWEQTERFVLPHVLWLHHLFTARMLCPALIFIASHSSKAHSVAPQATSALLPGTWDRGKTSALSCGRN